MDGYRRVNVRQNRDSATANRRKPQATSLVIAERNQVSTAIRADPERAIAGHDEQPMSKRAAQRGKDIVVQHHGLRLRAISAGRGIPRFQPGTRNAEMGYRDVRKRRGRGGGHEVGHRMLTVANFVVIWNVRSLRESLA